MRLDGKVAVVTGGAGAIGRATATMLAANGAAVAVMDIDGPGAAEVASLIRAGGGDARHVRCDVGEPSDIVNAVEETAQAFGRIDILHNNAAATGLAREHDPDLLSLDVEVWDAAMRINLRSAMLMTKAALPHLLAHGNGSVINMSSTAGLAGSLAQTAYGTTKAAMIALTRATATQYGKDGVRCNAIAPGLIVTDTNAAFSEGRVGQIMLRHHLTPRLGTPDDVAHAVCWLASDAAGFVTGAVIPVDGGMLSHAPTVADVRDLNRTGR